jgi:predicted glutamine amidotransferase
VQADGVYIRSPALAQRVVLVASVPLTDEPWQAMEEGSLIVLRDGSVVSVSS